jgi:hypothetical protein
LKKRDDSFPLLGRVFCLFLISRLFLSIFVYLGDVLRPSCFPNTHFYPGVLNCWVNPWTLWDSEWFLQIATHGYQASTTAFFPLYPFLLSWAAPDEIKMAVWGVALSNSCFLFALYFFYRLTALDYDEKTAASSVFLLAFFPTTAFFSAVYTESLFLLLSVWAFYCARKQSWILAGLLAGLAGLTRNSGWILCLMLGIEYVQYLRCKEKNIRWGEVLSLLLPFLTFAGTIGFFAWKFHSLTAGLDSQEYFYRSWSWPWTLIRIDLFSFWRGFGEIFALKESLNIRYVLFNMSISAINFLDCLVPLAALTLLAKYRKILPFSYAIYIVLVLSMHLFYGKIAFPHTAGTLRYLMVTFPFIQLLGKWAQRFESNACGRMLALSFYGWLLVVASFAFGYKLFLG